VDEAGESDRDVSSAMTVPADSGAGSEVALAAPLWQPGAGGSERERLAQLDAVAGQYVASQRPANTLRAYAADWKAWEDYTEAAGIPLLAGTAGALVGFVWWLETTKQAAPATIDRRLTGAVVGLRQLSAPLEPTAALAARQALGGYRRRLAEAGISRGRGQARPITVPELRTVSLNCPDTLAGVRDRALLLLGFAIASRCSDLANLLVTDIAPDPKGLSVTVRFGKAIGTSPIEYGHHLATCTLRAWNAWTAAAAITTGPAFRRVDRHDHLLRDGLSPQAVDHALVRAGRRANLPYKLTAHCLRSGLATEARRAGKRDDVIAAQGRWQPGSRALQQYFRQVDRWTENALTDLGL
jgi:integrase